MAVQTQPRPKPLATADKFIDLTTSGLAGLGVLTVAVLGIVLSYDALLDLARQSGVVNPWLVWAWPLMLDSVAVVASLYVLWAEVRRQRATYAWGLLIGFTVASVLFNALHANFDTLNSLSPYAPAVTATTVAVLPPIAAALTLHLFVTLLRAIFERLTVLTTITDLAAQTAAARSRLEQLTADEQQQTEALELLQAKAEALKSEVKALQTEKRVPNKAAPADISSNTRAVAQTIIEGWLSQGLSLERKGAELSRQLSTRLGRRISPRTGSELLREYHERPEEIGMEAVVRQEPAPGEADRWGDLIDALPMDTAGNEALHRIKDRAIGPANGNKGINCEL